MLEDGRVTCPALPAPVKPGQSAYRRLARELERSLVERR
jgi:hypothetical protein